MYRNTLKRTPTFYTNKYKKRLQKFRALLSDEQKREKKETVRENTEYHESSVDDH